jgi:hypothetical protein
VKDIAKAAPTDVAHVRTLVTDDSAREQLQLMGRAREHIVARIDISGVDSHAVLLVHTKLEVVPITGDLIQM